MACHRTYEAALKPESIRFKHLSQMRLQQLYLEKKKIVEDLGGRVAERNDPIVTFPLWVKVAFLDEVLRHGYFKNSGRPF